MHEEIIKYTIGSDTFHGYAVYDPKLTSKRPSVLVAHAWRGQDDFARSKAQELAELGYLAFAADLYGQGLHVKSNEEAPALMLPLFTNRKVLQERICAAYDTLSQHKFADRNRIGAIGFCFGGLTVIELLRSGVNLRGVVSFHGLLGNGFLEFKADPVPISPNVKGAILILHGHDDPMVSKEDIENIQQELTLAKVDWQLYVYGNTAHAFTNPEAADKKGGMVFNPVANKRAWQSMRNFFEEMFK